MVNIIKARNLKAMDIGGTSGMSTLGITPSTHPGGGLGGAGVVLPAWLELSTTLCPQTPT